MKQVWNHLLIWPPCAASVTALITRINKTSQLKNLHFWLWPTKARNFEKRRRTFHWICEHWLPSFRQMTTTISDTVDIVNRILSYLNGIKTYLEDSLPSTPVICLSQERNKIYNFTKIIDFVYIPWRRWKNGRNVASVKHKNNLRLTNNLAFHLLFFCNHGLAHSNSWSLSVKFLCSLSKQTILSSLPFFSFFLSGYSQLPNEEIVFDLTVLLCK